MKISVSLILIFGLGLSQAQWRPFTAFKNQRKGGFGGGPAFGGTRGPPFGGGSGPFGGGPPKGAKEMIKQIFQQCQVDPKDLKCPGRSKPAPLPKLNETCPAVGESFNPIDVFAEHQSPCTSSSSVSIKIVKVFALICHVI
jgi:hypothetical protein